MPERCSYTCDRARSAASAQSFPLDDYDFDKLRAVLEKEWRQALVRYSAPPLTEMMEYALQGGKSLRGLLLLAAADSCNAQREQAWDAAAAIEMIHAASLAVDDLPALDDSPMRRGRLSLHKRFGESAAVLTAHALVAAAFQLMAQIPNEPERLLQMTGRLAAAVGGNGMALAQLIDRPVPAPPRDDLRALKTGSLFQMAAVTGAALARVHPKLVEDLGQLGLKLGVCYQIVDDFCDNAMDPTDRQALREEGLRTWRECAQLFNFVRDELHDVLPLERWFDWFHRQGAKFLEPQRSELEMTGSRIY